MRFIFSLVLVLFSTIILSQTQLGSDITGEQSGDWFGKTVSISDDGTTLAVGAGFNDGNGSNSGHVRVYKWDGSSYETLNKHM